MTVQQIMDSYVVVNGHFVPTGDTDCSRVIFKMAEDLPAVLRHVTDFTACVQAGGNFGVWARALAPKFGAVYTFEPHPDNFGALTMNTLDCRNVVRFQAALGNTRGELVGLGLDPKEERNYGAFFVEPGAGTVPTLLVDDLGLETCGLLALDVEGFELPALCGARATLERCRPIVVIEDKGLSRRYGVAKGEAVEHLVEFHGYEVAERIARDVVLRPVATS